MVGVVGEVGAVGELRKVVVVGEVGAVGKVGAVGELRKVVVVGEVGEVGKVGVVGVVGEVGAVGELGSGRVGWGWLRAGRMLVRSLVCVACVWRVCVPWISVHTVPRH